MIPELIEAFDDSFQSLGFLDRKMVHDHQLWHKVCSYFVINPQKGILFHERSPHKTKAGLIGSDSAGGHLSQGKNIQDELLEELGISSSLNFLGTGILNIPQNKEIIFLYTTVTNQEDFVIDSNEMLDIFWLDYITALKFFQKTILEIEVFYIKSQTKKTLTIDSFVEKNPDWYLNILWNLRDIFLEEKKDSI